ncbi:MAG: hypothetical protein ACXWKG_05450 [Limisphaerales bacterium]
MKTLFKYISAAFLFCSALNANTQAAGLVNYQASSRSRAISSLPVLCSKKETPPPFTNRRMAG